MIDTEMQGGDAPSAIIFYRALNGFRLEIG
jgi:hypothetical protein